MKKKGSKKSIKKSIKGSKVPILVRLKPLGVGIGGKDELKLKPTMQFDENSVWSDNRCFKKAEMIIPPEGNQDYSYKAIMSDLLKQFFNGIDVNIIAYGQTGSGKTHSLFGPPNYIMKSVSGGVTLDEMKGGDFGVMPRALARIFEYVKSLEDNGDVVVKLYGSLLEIHMMCLKDLLNNKSGVQIDKKFSVPVGEQVWALDDFDTIKKYLLKCESRTTRATQMNDTSSRSHCISCFIFDQMNPVTGMIKTSRLQFVDLAGSERMNEAHGNINPLTSAGAIEGIMTNCSLLGLSMAVNDMSRSYRKRGMKKAVEETKAKYGGSGGYMIMTSLTSLLGKTFLGMASSMFLIMVSQTPKNKTQSENSLQFAERCVKMPMRPKQNAKVSLKNEIINATKKLKENKRALEKLQQFGDRNKKYVGIRKAYVTHFRSILRRMKQLEIKMKRWRREMEKKNDEVDDGVKFEKLASTDE